MTTATEQASRLIDAVADAMDAHQHPLDRFWAGHSVLNAYLHDHPDSIWPLAQGVDYLFSRMRMDDRWNQAE